LVERHILLLPRVVWLAIQANVYRQHSPRIDARIAAHQFSKTLRKGPGHTQQYDRHCDLRHDQSLNISDEQFEQQHLCVLPFKGKTPPMQVS